MKSFLETVIGGAIGLMALYVVGKVAYQAGKDMGRAETECEHLQDRIDKHDSDTAAHHGEDQDGEDASVVLVQDEIDASAEESLRKVPMKRSGKLSMALSALKLLRHKESKSVIGDLVKHPESHKIEAFVEGGDLRINVSKRPAFA